jgi:anti-sigma factor ChrR (cupin superfamily)
MRGIAVNTNQLIWEEASSYPDGTMMKVLRDDGTARSVLLKLPRGFHMGAHTHTGGEQHLVLEGEYELGGETYGPGAYRYVPAHTDHGPFTSRDGALVLVIWEA